MKTPIEKAIEITFKYQDLVTSWNCYWDCAIFIEDKMDDMKQCALIAVDEILNSNPKEFGNIINALKYWQEVKTEINNL